VFAFPDLKRKRRERTEKINIRPQKIKSWDYKNDTESDELLPLSQIMPFPFLFF